LIRRRKVLLSCGRETVLILAPENPYIPSIVVTEDTSHCHDDDKSSPLNDDDTSMNMNVMSVTEETSHDDKSGLNDDASWNI